MPHNSWSRRDEPNELNQVTCEFKPSWVRIYKIQVWPDHNLQGQSLTYTLF